jgi:hypothetical protein
MRHRLLCSVVIGAAVAAMGSFSAAGQAVGCCPVGYGFAAAPFVPPTGYVLNPSDARAPFYVVNQGPLYKGPGIFAVPTYSEGRYAFSPYPYVPPWAGPYGYGPGYGPYVAPSYRPYGAPPYGAYFHRPSPSARVIDVRRHYGHARPPGPHAFRPHHAAPRAGMPPQAMPPLPPPRPDPGKPVDELWTRGLAR